MTKQELLEAYKALTHCIDQYISNYTVEYITSELAPSTYKGMINYREEFGQFLVYSGGDHGHLGQEYNIKFRAVHDHGHYTLGLNFSVQDETELSNQSMYEFRTIAKDLGYSQEISDNIARIIDCEVRQQREYYSESGEYVADQKDFIDNILLDNRIVKKTVDKQIMFNTQVRINGQWFDNSPEFGSYSLVSNYIKGRKVVEVVRVESY